MMVPPLAASASVVTELFVAMKLCPALIWILPVFPVPVLLEEMDAPSEIVTDCPAVRAMLPPEPESGSVPIVRLKIPPGVPSLRVPDNEIKSDA